MASYNEQNISSSDSELSNDEMKPIDFYFAKNNIYNWNELDIDEQEKIVLYEKFDENKKKFDLWEKKFNLDHIHLSDDLKFHYADHSQELCIAFIINVENLAVTITRGRHLKRQIYLEPFAIGQATSIFNIHSYLMQITNDKLEKKANFLDFSLIRINAGRLPIDKITYFKDLAIYYEGIEKILYRGKEKYCLVARVISGKILLPKKYQCNICEKGCNKDCSL